MTKRLQATFTGGEISPDTQGRVDLDLFYQSAKTIKNWIIKPSGGLENRPGLKYVDNVADTDQRLVLFNTNGANYILVFVNQKIYFIKDGAVIQSYTTDYYLTTTYVTADLWKLKFAQDADILYISGGGSDYPLRKLARTTDTNWAISNLEIDDGPWIVRESMQDTKLDFTISTSGIECDQDVFTSGDVGNYIKVGLPDPLDSTIIQWSTAEITAYLTAKAITIDPVNFISIPVYNWKGSRFERYGTDYSTVETGTGTVTFQKETDGEYTVTFNSGSTPALASAALRSKPITVEPNQSYAFWAYKYGLGAYPAGTTMGIKVGTSEGDGSLLTSTVIGPYSLETFAVGTNTIIFIELTYSNTNANTKLSLMTFMVTHLYNSPPFRNWYISYGDSNGEYPYATTINEQRHVLAGYDNYPHRINHSVVGKKDNFDFNTPYAENEAFSYDIDTKIKHNIKWLANLNQLVIGTDNGIFRANGGPASATMSGSYLDVKRKSKIKCDILDPLEINNQLIILHKGKKQIHVVIESAEYGFQNEQINIIANHLFDGLTVKDWAYQDNPYRIIWIVLSDGSLVGCTYIPEARIVAWQRFETDGDFTAVETFPGDDLDTMYFVVKRAINSVSKYYIEFMMPRTLSTVVSGITGDTVDDFFFLDCAKEYSSPGSTSLTGLAHLEGETVYALCDGAVKGPYTVSSGTITIDSALYTSVKVGLKYNSDLELLDLSRDPGAKKPITDMLVNVYKTRSLKAGKDADNLTLVNFREPGIGGNPINLFTGYKRCDFEYQDERVATAYFRNDEPVPCSILAVLPDYDYE